MNEFNRKIFVIGYGEMGHAMEFLLAGRHELAFHDIRPMAGHESVALEAGAAQADYVIYCVPVTPLAEQTRELLMEGRGDEIGPLLDENFNLRSQIYPISPGNRELVERAQKENAHVHFAGSGGAVVGVYRDDSMFVRLAHSYAQMGAKTIIGASGSRAR